MDPFDIKARKKEYNRKHREKKRNEKKDTKDIKEKEETSSTDTIIIHEEIYQPRVKFLEMDVSNDCTTTEIDESETIQEEEEEEEEEVEEAGEVFRMTEDEFNAFIEQRIKERTQQERQTVMKEPSQPISLPQLSTDSFFFHMMKTAGTMAMSQLTNLMIVSAVGMGINMLANTTKNQPFSISPPPIIPSSKQNMPVQSQPQNNTPAPPIIQLNAPVGNLF